MKKILKILASFTFVSTSASNVVSCTKDNKNYTTFINWIKEDKSFVLMIGAKDDKSSESMHTNLWNGLISNPTKQLGSTVTGTSWFDYKSTNQNEFKNIQLKSLSGNVSSELWGENWAKNILKWTGEKSFEARTNNPKYKNQSYINKYEQFFQTAPLFIFINKGKFQGIEQGLPVTTNAESKNALPSWRVFFKWTDSIMVQGAHGLDSTWDAPTPPKPPTPKQ